MRKDKERHVGRFLQAQKGGDSPEENGYPLDKGGGVHKSDPNVGMYYGCPTPISKSEYTGANMDKEMDSLQSHTRSDSSGGGKGHNQATK